MNSKCIAERVNTAAIDNSWWWLTATQRWGPVMADTHRLTRRNAETRTNLVSTLQRGAMAIIVEKINEL